MHTRSSLFGTLVHQAGGTGPLTSTAPATIMIVEMSFWPTLPEHEEKLRYANSANQREIAI
jgi:hypothetical protein